MTLNIQNSADLKKYSLLTLSRDPSKAIEYTLDQLTQHAKNPLVIAFGSIHPYTKMSLPLVQVDDVNKVNDILMGLKSEAKNFDGLFVDSVSLFRRMLISAVAGEGTVSIQEYGIINNRIVNFIIPASRLFDNFATTAAFVRDDDKSGKQGKEVWEHDLTSNIRATLFPQFSQIHYVGNSTLKGDWVQTDRSDAIDGTAPKSEKTSLKAKGA